MTTLLALVCGLAVGLLAGLLLERSRIRRLQADLADAHSQQARLEALADALRQQNEQTSRMLKESDDEMRRRADAMKAEFRDLANEILDSKASSLKQTNRNWDGPSSTAASPVRARRSPSTTPCRN